MPAGSQSANRTGTSVRNDGAAKDDPGWDDEAGPSATLVLSFLKRLDNATSDDQLLHLARSFVDS